MGRACQGRTGPEAVLDGLIRSTECQSRPSRDGRAAFRGAADRQLIFRYPSQAFQLEAQWLSESGQSPAPGRMEDIRRPGAARAALHGEA
jgi:hypothetical protein